MGNVRNPTEEINEGARHAKAWQDANGKWHNKNVAFNQDALFLEAFPNELERKKRIQMEKTVAGQEAKDRLFTQLMTSIKGRNGLEFLKGNVK